LIDTPNFLRGCSTLSPLTEPLYKHPKVPEKNINICNFPLKNSNAATATATATLKDCRNPAQGLTEVK